MMRSASCFVTLLLVNNLLYFSKEARKVKPPTCTIEALLFEHQGILLHTQMHTNG